MGEKCVRPHFSRFTVATIVVAEFLGTSLWFSANAAADDLERAWGLPGPVLGLLGIAPLVRQQYGNSAGRR